MNRVIHEWMLKHPEHEYYLMCLRPLRIDTSDIPANWHIINTPWIIDKSSLWFVFKLPRLIKELGLDVYWGPNYSLPLKMRGADYVLTINDLALFHFKGIGHWRTALQIKLFLKHNAHISRRILTISEATKRDIVSLFGIDPEKITVTLLGGVDEPANSEPESIDSSRFFLFVGTIEPRKNIPTILKAYEIYRRQSRENTARLVLAGGRGWKCDAIYEAIKKHPYTEDIDVPGFVSDEERERLYRRATAFLYPSLYEGFGIPILEAFSYGLPVITANNSSLPEVGGDAAFYVDSYDAEGIAKYMSAIEQLSASERSELRMRIRKQSERFSWEKCAEETLAAIVHR